MQYVRYHTLRVHTGWLPPVGHPQGVSPEGVPWGPSKTGILHIGYYGSGSPLLGCTCTKWSFWGWTYTGGAHKGVIPGDVILRYLGVVCQHDVSHLGCIINHMLHQIPGCVVWGTPRNVSFWGGTYRVLRLWQSTFGGIHMGS